MDPEHKEAFLQNERDEAAQRLHSGTFRANIYPPFPLGKEEGANYVTQQTSFLTLAQLPQEKKKTTNQTSLGIHPSGFYLLWTYTPLLPLPGYRWGILSLELARLVAGALLGTVPASPFLLRAGMLCLLFMPVPSESPLWLLPLGST